MSRAAIVTYRYHVRGTGAFPIDMLRHDRATPMSESDSAIIERTLRPRERGEFQVHLTSRKVPTPERWHSFGWKIDGEVERVRT